MSVTHTYGWQCMLFTLTMIHVVRTLLLHSSSVWARFTLSRISSLTVYSIVSPFKSSSADSAAVDHRMPLFSVFIFWLNFVHKHCWSPYSTLRAATKELTGGRLAKKWICDKTNDLLWLTCVLAGLLFKKSERIQLDVKVNFNTFASVLRCKWMIPRVCLCFWKIVCAKYLVSVSASCWGCSRVYTAV